MAVTAFWAFAFVLQVALMLRMVSGLGKPILSVDRNVLKKRFVYALGFMVIGVGFGFLLEALGNFRLPEEIWMPMPGLLLIASIVLFYFGFAQFIGLRVRHNGRR